jgi:Thiolase, N-terminal domain
VRIPFACYGGSLSHRRLDNLLGMTMRGACERLGVALEQIENIVAGCVNTAHEGISDVARWAALAASFPDCPPEPPSEDAEDGRHDERTHDQRVEQQADAYGGTYLTDGSEFAREHRQHGEREHQTRGRHDIFTRGSEILKSGKLVAKQQISGTRKFAKCVVFNAGPHDMSSPQTYRLMKSRPSSVTSYV